MSLLLAAFKQLGIGHAAGCHDHHIRIERRHVFGLGPGVEVKHNIARGTLSHAPVNDADHLTPTWALRCQADLPAGIRLGFKHGHIMPTLCCDPRGLKPCWACPHDHHLLALGRWHNLMRHCQLAPGCRVVHTQRFARLINPVQAVGRANTGTDVVFTSLYYLFDDMRVGHMCTRHARHIQQASLHSMTRCGHIRDFRRVEGRHPSRLLHLACEIQMRCIFHALHWDHIGHRRIGVNTPPDHVEEIHHPAVRQAFGNLDPFFRRDAPRFSLIRCVAQANDELVAHALADRLQHIHRELQAAFQRPPAVGAFQIIGQRRPELVKQVTIDL